MGFLQRACIALGFVFTASVATASPAKPEDGVDYRTLPQAQLTDSGNKVEVVEFFGYFCPHCHEFDEPLTNWAKKQGDKIVFKRVPVAFRDSLVPQQKLFYTLESMGKLESLHPNVFKALHEERNRLDTDVAIGDWAAKNGLDKKKFMEMFNSFAVQAKARRATQLQNAYRIDSVPTIAVDGRFITSPSIAGASLRGMPESAMHGATFQVMDWLVTRAAKK